MSQFTIFGGSGFIGSEIVKKLKSEKKMYMCQGVMKTYASVKI